MIDGIRKKLYNLKRSMLRRKEYKKLEQHLESVLAKGATANIG